MPDLSDTQPRPFWSQDWEALQEPLTKLRRSIASLPTSPLRVMRVSQLDADLLDVELFGVLKDQLWQALSFFRPTFKETFEPEFVIILQLILYRLSIYESGASYGKQLQNLNYRNERGHRGGLESIAIDSTLTRFQRIMYGAITVGGQYAWTRLNRLVTAQGWGDLGETNPRKTFWNLMQRGEGWFKTLSLLNFLVFLYNGKYRTLVDRALSMRLVYSRKSISRQVSFEFLNRQLVWHAFTEFLLFLMPLINIEKLKLRLSRALLPHSYLSSSASSLGYAQLPLHICVICHENSSAGATTLAGTGGGIHVGLQEDTTVHNPYITNCGHVYCYWCVSSKMGVYEGEWGCLRCGERVTTVEKWAEKVLQEGEEREEEIMNDIQFG
ncbi:Pex12 amino terminal region-domain-containing protein [Jimgerdemannia flammicorona]|uniref:RING-type E3 ubiquitin transferase (cysteine targeting) n=1 Tax=Jimgerdemannia flammicorona TaxID=994334 RepID=A0A433BA66_9FUNG|nr:Pex12 amino terminal region-domain-containing protein [Jimgerdemannia flammicorona]